MLDFTSNFDPGPGNILVLPEFISALGSGPGRPSPESGNIVQLPDIAVDSYSGLGKFLLTSMDTLSRSGSGCLTLGQCRGPDFVFVFDPGPVVLSSPEPGARFGKPKCGDQFDMPHFVSVFNTGPRKPFLGSGDVLE